MPLLCLLISSGEAVVISRKILGLEETEEALIWPLVRLSAVSVNLVGGDVAVLSCNDAGDDTFTVATVDLFPRIGASVPGIGVSGALVDEEETKRAFPVFSGCNKERGITGELNNVVEFKGFEIEFTHGTPPSIFA